MGRKSKIGLAALLIAGLSAVLLVRKLYKSDVLIEGVTLTQDADPRRQAPIPNVELTARLGETVAHAKSDATGAFRLSLPGKLWRRESVDLQFQRPGFQTLEITEPLRQELYVIRMKSLSAEASAEPSGQLITLKDVRVRYATKTNTPVNVGSIARTFEVVNTGGVPCDQNNPCSPDSKWKAANGGLTLDAGEGHEFRNIRTSCIAGPCPFTKIDSGQFPSGGRVIKISVRAWSDTVTFLVEAEVIQTTLTDLIRDAYPAIFGRQMSFTLPPVTQGPSIEADTNGTEIVYPLGPDLTLSWAVCNVQSEADRSKLYRCELKPGYRFQ